MSSDPSAMLVYGIDMGNVDEEGVEYANVPRVDDDGNAVTDRDSDKWDECEEDEDFIDTAETESGAKRVVYGSWDYPGHILGFEVEVSPDWGACPLPPLAIDPTWDATGATLHQRLEAGDVRPDLARHVHPPRPDRGDRVGHPLPQRRPLLHAGLPRLRGSPPERRCRSRHREGRSALRGDRLLPLPRRIWPVTRRPPPLPRGLTESREATRVDKPIGVVRFKRGGDRP